MSVFIYVFAILLVLVIDIYWLGAESKRWNWMKGWSKQNKILFFTVFIIAIGLIYLGSGIK